MNQSSYLGDLRLLIGHSRERLALALLLMLFSAALDLICVAVLPMFITWVLSSRNPQIAIFKGVFQDLGIAQASTLTIAVAMVGLFAFRAVTSVFVGAYLSQLAQTIRKQNATRIISANLRSPYIETLRHSVADGITTAAGHTANFANSVVLPLLRLVADLSTIVALLAFLAWLSPLLTASLTAVLAVTALSYNFLISRSSRKHSQRVVQLDAEFGENTSQALQGRREVRIYQASGFYLGEIARILSRLEHSQARLGAIYWLPRALGELLLILMAVAYIIFALHGGKSETIAIANLSAFALVGMRLLPAFSQSVVGIAMLRAGQPVTTLLASAVRRADVFTQDRLNTAPASQWKPMEQLELRNVHFAYENTAPVLNGIDFKICKGQSVGIIGRSGAGKSTLGDLILGLLQPQQGIILLNGREVSLEQAAWWQQVGFVPQVPFIAKNTLARNVAYGLPDAEIDLSRLMHAIELAQLGALVREWPDGVNTPLGEFGVRLSGGQRQRVAIARALYRNREFLVLDEATSALDNETEREITQALAALHGKVTMLVIAHRESTLKSCDFIVEIKNGLLAIVR